VGTFVVYVGRIVGKRVRVGRIVGRVKKSGCEGEAEDKEGGVRVRCGRVSE